MLIIGKMTTFYLDYVGCKVIDFLDRVFGDKGFISTMWDVKGNNQQREGLSE